MDILVDIVLPLSLAFIMFSLGIGLSLGDFTRVALRARPFLLGAICQLVFLPVVAFGLIMAFGLEGELAAGLMLLSFCPGGVTSNVLSRLARGDVALSVSLTAVVSLLSILTLPLLVSWAVVYFMGADAPEVSATSLAIAMFLITAVPVAIGMILRAAATDFIARIEGAVIRVATVLFVLIVIAAIATNWDLFTENVVTLGPSTALLVLITLGLGFLCASVFGMTWQERKTIAIEAGIQNGTLGITLAPLIVVTATGLPALALPSAIHGVMMYLVAVPFVLFVRGRGDG